VDKLDSLIFRVVLSATVGLVNMAVRKSVRLGGSLFRPKKKPPDFSGGPIRFSNVDS